MGQLALGAAGAVAGGFLGGPVGAQYGFALGSLAGGLVFGPGGKNQVQEGPRLDDLRVATSRYGTPMISCFGPFRLPGHIIWSEGIREHAQENTESQGKGGGGPEVTQRTFSYTCSWAAWFCDGEMDDVLRIWFDAKLMYDNRPEASTETRAASQAWANDHFVFHPGSETQSADSTIAAVEGAANTPAFLGSCYIVFIDCPLEDHGNRIPNVTAEIASSAKQSNYLGCAEGGENGVVWTVPTVTYNPGRLNGDLYNQTYGFAFSPDKQYVAVCGGPAPRTELWRTSDWTRVAQPTTLAFRVGRKCEFSRDGKELVVVHSDGDGIIVYTVPALDVASGPATPPGDSAEGIGFHPQQQFVGIGYNGGLKMYTYPDWADLGLSGPEASVPYTCRDVSFSPDGSYCAVCQNWGPAVLFFGVVGWGLISGPPGLPTNYTGYVVSWSPDGAYCALGSSLSPYLIVWSTGGGSAPSSWTKLATVASPPTRFVSGLAWNADSSELAVGWATGGTGIMDRYKVSDWSKYSEPGGLVSGPLTRGHQAGYDIGLVSPNAVSHQDMVSTICQKAGLESTDYDVSDLLGFESGFAYGAQSGRSALENLAVAGLFQGVKSGGQLVFSRRGAHSGLSIDEEDMALLGDGPALKITLPDEVEIPHRLSITYPQREKLYQKGEAHQQRLITRSTKEESIEVRVAMEDERAAQLADTLLFELWSSRRFEFALPISYLALDPGDVITITRAGESYTVRITSISIQGLSLLQCEAIEEHLGLYTSQAVGVGGPADSAAVAAVPATTALLLDLPMLLGTQDTTLMYYTLLGSGAAWLGGALFESRDQGASFSQVASRSVSGKAGIVDTTLATGGVATWDMANTLDVTLDDTSQTLESRDRLAVLNGANVAAVGAHGRWEIIQFRVATLLAPGQYRISEFLRGRLGTEHNTHNHTGTDRFVFLEAALVGVRQTQLSEIGLERLYKGVSVGQDAAGVSSSAYAYQGENLKPYSPVAVAGVWDGSNNLELSWVRRSRHAPALLQHPIVGEASESYEIDILAGAAVVNTYTSSEETFTYTAAAQTADGLTPGAALDVEIFQMSESVGRGQPVAATIAAA